MKSIATGFTLVEILIVVSIMGIAALVVMPDISPTQSIQLEVAAEEIADAIQFARSESIRKRSEHGVIIDSTTQRVRVFSADTSTTPPTINYDVYHPLSKRLYDLKFIDHSFAHMHSLNLNSTTNGSCDTPGTIIFDIYGSAFCGDPYTSLIIDLDIDLSLDRASEQVKLTGTTGRVAVR